MTGYCTTAQLVSLTGTNLPSATVQAIIDQGGREIDAYLAPYGITVSASVDAAITANIKLSQAELYNLQRIDVDHPFSYGSDGQLGNIDTVGMMQELRKQGFAILDQYVQNQQSLSVNRRPRVVKVRGC